MSTTPLTFLRNSLLSRYTPSIDTDDTESFIYKEPPHEILRSPRAYCGAATGYVVPTRRVSGRYSWQKNL